MTPDWAAGPITVPYASFGDPQSLNLYAYGGNNPNSAIDLDGHDYGASMGSNDSNSWPGTQSQGPTVDGAPNLPHPQIADVNVCVNGNCGTLSDPTYDAAQSNGKFGTNAPTLLQLMLARNGFGGYMRILITDSNGKVIGYAIYVQDTDNATLLAQAMNKTGVQSITNPCFIGGFYAASAVGAVAAGDTLAAGEIGEAGTAIRTAAQASKTLQAVDRAKWWLGIAGLYEVATGKATQAWNWATGKAAAGCNAMQSW
jgi:hypothetical protein